MYVNISAVFLWVYVYLLFTKNASVYTVGRYAPATTAGAAVDVYAWLHADVGKLLCLADDLLRTD